MTRTLALATRLALLIALAATIFPQAAQAGLPLTCWPFDIGGAKSLPWAGNTDNRQWNTPASDYDTRRLADDTIALLAPDTPVIVRMETIRRAAIYGTKDHRAAEELLMRLRTRALDPKAGKAQAHYLFDYGYLIETYKQAFYETKSSNPAAGLSGYGEIVKASQSLGRDPGMEFAAALITSWPRTEAREEHFQKSLAGASKDALLARNLISHFPDRSGALAQSRAKYGSPLPWGGPA